jgi:hypothetical protein
MCFDNKNILACVETTGGLLGNIYPLLFYPNSLGLTVCEFSDREVDKLTSKLLIPQSLNAVQLSGQIRELSCSFTGLLLFPHKQEYFYYQNTSGGQEHFFKNSTSFLQ